MVVTLWLPGLQPLKLSYSDIASAWTQFSGSDEAVGQILPGLQLLFEGFRPSRYADTALQQLRFVFRRDFQHARYTLVNAAKIIDDARQSGFHWLYRIAPVFLCPDRDQLLLCADLDDPLRRNGRLPELVETINSYFSENDFDRSWQLRLSDTGQCYLLSEHQLSNHAIPFYFLKQPLVREQAYHQWQRHWQQTMNEMQMFLHQKYKASAEVFCNSLWLWGETPLDQSDECNTKPLFGHYEHIYSNSSLIRELAKMENRESADISQFQQAISQINGNVLIVMDNFVYPHLNPMVVLEQLLQLEKTLFEPLAKNCEQVDKIQWISATGRFQFISGGFFSRLWRCGKSLLGKKNQLEQYLSAL